MTGFTTKLKVALALAVAAAILVVASCSSDKQESATSMSGKKAFETYCRGCHQNVSPKHLPKDIWQEVVLPRMGTRLGMYTTEYKRSELLEDGAAKQILVEQGIYPTEAIIDSSTWQALQTFVIESAPVALDVDPQPTPDRSSQWKLTPGNTTYSPPSTTLIRAIDEGSFYLGDAHTGTLTHIDRGQIVKQALVGETAVDIKSIGQQLLVLTMGSFSPTDAPTGKLIALSNKTGKQVILFDSLQRPVDLDIGDLNGDNQPDIAVAEFGKWTGGLSILKSHQGKLVKEKLDYDPGCITSHIVDLNQDGNNDIVALFGQGNERITAYFGDGSGNYASSDLVTFHPSMGSASLQLQDLDDDGDLDIVYCAGDNADYSPILKPYHGIYFFLQDDKGMFDKTLHLPMHGAYGAEVYDYDQDGDKDIIAISYFPDFDVEGTSVIYFENQEASYVRKSLAQHQEGRWIVAESTDYDGDGDIDVLLGSLVMEAPKHGKLVDTWVSQGTAYALLENLHR